MADRVPMSRRLSSRSIVRAARMLKAATTRMKLRMANVAHFSARLVEWIRAFFSRRVRVNTSPGQRASMDSLSSSGLQPAAGTSSIRDTFPGRWRTVWAKPRGAMMCRASMSALTLKVPQTDSRSDTSIRSRPASGDHPLAEERLRPRFGAPTINVAGASGCTGMRNWLATPSPT